MHRKRLLTELDRYAAQWSDELSITAFSDFVRRQPQCFSRATVEGHVTASAWVVDRSGRRVLMLHHAKLAKWLQPGGHADGDSDTLAVATKEVQEETGLTQLAPATNGIFDLDIHPIPARADDPEHLHYDVRYALQLTAEQDPVGNHESTDLQWFDITAVAEWEEPSLARMAAKWLRHAEANG